MFSIFSRRGSPRGANGASNNDVEMDGVPRSSTETQRRNGYRQSRADDRGARIIEDLQNGVYQCSICVGTIYVGDNPDSVWHCRTCHNVVHYRCASDWATANGIAGVGGRRVWKCPNCQTSQDDQPRSRCWCGKEVFGRIPLLGRAEIPNACPSECQQRGQCSHGLASICLKDCHPGPCEFLCADTCTGRHPPPPPRTPSSWEKMCQRVHGREAGSLSWLIICSTFIVVTYTLGGVLLYFDILWWTKPYKYPGWAESKGYGAQFGIAFGLIIFQILTLPVIYLLTTSLASILNAVLNLNSLATKTGRKYVAQFYGPLGLFIFGVGLWALPIVGFTGGVDIVWYNQMKDSCNGFDVRINMDTYKFAATEYKARVDPQLSSKLIVSSPRIEDQDFHLGSHIKPIANSAEPFQYYHRLSGHTSTTPHVAIDIDFHNHLWRRMVLNDTDITNAWMATNSNVAFGAEWNLSLPLLPKFSPIEETLSGNGSFTKFSKSDPHLRINGLDLAIADMHGFFTSCYQEPFLRVFDMRGMSDTEGRKVLDAMWDNKPNDKVVMRTASFGHGRQKLSMCVKAGEVIESIKDKFGKEDRDDLAGLDSVDDLPGIQDEMLIPFAIVAATRMRVKEAGIRGTSC